MLLSSKSTFLCFFAVKPTVIHTDMFVNSIGPVNAINMVSKASVMLQGGRVQLLGGRRGHEEGLMPDIWWVEVAARRPLQLSLRFKAASAACCPPTAIAAVLR